MGPKTRELVGTLEELATLLHRHGESHWAAWIESDLERIRAGDLAGVAHLQTAFGGMGSFDDLVLDPRNGHRVDDAELDAVNARLSRLRSYAWSLATEIAREAAIE